MTSSVGVTAACVCMVGVSCLDWRSLLGSFFESSYSVGSCTACIGIASPCCRTEPKKTLHAFGQKTMQVCWVLFEWAFV